MAERIEPADSEALVVKHLASRMPGVDVRGFRYGAPRSRQVQVRKTGGNPRDLAVGRHQITVTTWGASTTDEAATYQLAATALSWLTLAEREGWLADTPCPSVAVLSEPYPDPDPTTGRARYSFTVVVDLRGTVHPA